MPLVTKKVQSLGEKFPVIPSRNPWNRGAEQGRGKFFNLPSFGVVFPHYCCDYDWWRWKTNDQREKFRIYHSPASGGMQRGEGESCRFSSLVIKV